MYRYLATTEEGFLQQLAVCYLANGYYFYVPGVIPEGKDPVLTDQKILRKYGIAMSKWGRYRRRKMGAASLQYLRLDRFFLILGTEGRHRFFEEEEEVIRDVRRTPIRFRDYSVSYKNGHAHVRIERTTFEEMKAYFEGIAAKRPWEVLMVELEALPYERYAPVRAQLRELHRLVNRVRKAAGLRVLPQSCVWGRRTPCRPFDHVQVEEVPIKVAPEERATIPLDPGKVEKAA
jgi:hypothetical protein